MYDETMDFGTDVSGMDDTTALAACDADWDVVLLPAAAVFPDGTTLVVPGHRFVVAGGSPVGQVGSRYHPVQNVELLGFARECADRLGSTVARAGVTQGNGRFWCWVPVGEAGLVFSTAHHGRGAVCVQLAVPGGGGLVRLGPESESTLSFPHGPTLQARLDDPAEVAGWANGRVLAAAAELDRLSRLVVEPVRLGEVLEGVVPAGRAKSELQLSNRHAVMDAVAGRWVSFSGGGRDARSLLCAVAWYLDRGRRASVADRVDQSVDDSGWVTRAKFVAHAVLS